MTLNTPSETLDRETLLHMQLKKLQEMLSPLLKTNAFYRHKLIGAGVKRPEDVQTLDDYRHLPLTTKEELSTDQKANPPYGTNLTFPHERYIRIHQTSGTTGDPLRWLDTRESWDWCARCWVEVYRAAGITAEDRIFLAFSFGLFLGFWAAQEGAHHAGSLLISGGGMSSQQRLKALLSHEASVLVCTPTYALHLAEVAASGGIDIAGSGVRTTLHAGESGASLPSIKQWIERAWGARCYDHAGATEVGPWGYDCKAQAGMHLNEPEFICEVIDPATGTPAAEGELVITNLGRIGMPIIRYRTGDRVSLQTAPCDCGRIFSRLRGGVIGRLDDALIIRGVNVYPSAIENTIRRFPEVAEFAVDVYRHEALDQMEVRLEVNRTDPDGIVGRVAEEIQHVLGIRATVQAVPHNTLPRFELKAKRFTDHRKNETAKGKE